MAVVSALKLNPATWRYAASAYCLSHEGNALLLASFGPASLDGESAHLSWQFRDWVTSVTLVARWSRWSLQTGGAQIELHEALNLCNQARRGSKHAWMRGAVGGGPLL